MSKILNVSVIFIFVGLTAWTSGCISASSSEVRAPEFSSSQLNEDFDQLLQSLEESHPGLYWYQSKQDLETQAAQIRMEISDGMDLLNYYFTLSKMVASVGCGHTRIRLGSSRRQQLLDTARVLPVQLAIFKETLIVTSNTDHPSLPIGTRIQSINGIPESEIIAGIRSITASDGYNITGKDYYLSRSAFFTIPQYFNFGQNTVDIVYQEPSGKVLSDQLRLLPMSAVNQPQNNPGPLLDFNALDENTGLLRIYTFSGDFLEQNGFDYSEFLESSFQKLQSDGMSNLIIDLRGNGGGDDGYGSKLLSYLSPKNFPYYQSLEVTPHYSGWGNIKEDKQGKYWVTAHQDLGSHTPAKNRFSGRTYVLIDGGSFSATSEFAAMAQNLGVATFIGEETGGGACGNTSGSSKRVALKNTGITIRIPQWRYRVAIDAETKCGKGVIPEYGVKDSPLTEQDEILDYTTKLIRNEL